MNRILNFAIKLQRVSMCNNKIVAQNNYINTRAFFAGKSLWKEDRSAAPAQQTKKKTKPVPKITLIAQNQNITITTLDEAQKLAKRRDLQLVQVQKFDTKTQRPVYKLATTAEVLNEETPEAQVKSKDAEKDLQMKSEKSLTIGARISEHDLQSRLKQISKWLHKSHVVRILIQGNADESAKLENLYKAIEKSVKEPEVLGKIAQKRGKASMLKFNILPVHKKVEENAESKSEVTHTDTKKAQQV